MVKITLQSLFIISVYCFSLLSWAVDADGDGSDAVEEALAGTSDNDANERPYWWKTFNGDSADDRLGNSVSGAGDVNNDGYADFITGAYGVDNFSGSARVYSGVDGSVLYTVYGDSAYEYLGDSVSGAGDVNGDGYADFMTGAYGDDNNGSASGSVRVYSGVDRAVLYTMNGDSADDQLGYSVSGVGDVNNDGYADFIAGARGDDNNGSNSGSARVYSGVDSSVLYTAYGDSAYDYLGRSVSGAGDVNGDGYADFMAGAYGDDNNGSASGSVRVYSGVDGAVLYTMNGDSPGDSLGDSVSGAGDVNNDGYADFIAGAYSDDNNGGSSGSARVYSGVDGGVLYTVYGDSFGDQLGGSVSSAGDINNDGYADFIAGATDDDNNGTRSGSARVYSGVDGSVLYTVNGDFFHATLGGSVSDAGDVDGDGYADFIAGSSGTHNNGIVSGSIRVYLSSELRNDIDTDFAINSADLDKDGDGMPDTWENTYGLNPLNANDASGDLDSDGVSNVNEYSNGTDPTIVNLKTANDFDKDADADLFWRKADGTNVVWVMDSAAKSSANSLGILNSDYSLVGIADFDKDSDSDVLFRDSSGSNVIWLMESGVKETLVTVGSNNSAFLVKSVGDFDGDGDGDIYFRNDSTGQNVIWLMKSGGKINKGLNAFNANKYTVVDTADYDGDGDEDIFFRDNVTGENTIWVMENGLKQSNSWLGYNNPRFDVVGSEDFDNDGDADIFFRDNTGSGGSSENTVWVMENAAKQSNSWLGFNNSRFTVAALSDFDGDGDAEIYFRDNTGAANQCENAVWVMQTAAKQSLSWLGFNHCKFSVAGTADFDGDGDNDILYRDTAAGENTIWVIQNNAKTSNSWLGFNNTEFTAYFSD